MNGRELARLLGVSEATVSRLASGARQPSLRLMLTIGDKLGWSLQRQAEALRDGSYGDELTTRMRRRKAPARTAA